MKNFYLITLIILFNSAYGQQTQKLINEIDSLYFSGQKNAAFELALDLVEKGSQSPYILHRLGMSYLDNYQPKEGLHYLLLARKSNNDDSLGIAIHLDIAQAKYSLMLYEEALDELKVLIDLDEYRIPALTICMNIYSDTKQFQKAIDISKELISANPDFMPTIANIGYLFLDIGEPDSAIFYFNKADKLEPNNPIIINNLGNAYYTKGNYETALKLINESINIFDSNSYAYRNRAKVFIDSLISFKAVS
jgi:tetratricopeptide (TPR) repeat protein